MFSSSKQASQNAPLAIGDLLLLCKDNEWASCIGKDLADWAVEHRDVSELKPDDAGRFDVVVIAFEEGLDLRAIEAVRQQMPTAILIVISCGRPGGDDELRALQIGVDDYISIDEVKDEFLKNAIIQTKARRNFLNRAPSEDNFLKLIMHNADGVMIVDDGGVVQFLNPAAETLLGVDADEILGEVFGFPHTSDFIELTIVPGALSGRPDPESPVLRVEMRVTPIVWQGTPSSLVSLRDVTARHNIRTKMQHYAAELARSNKELEQFAYAASHDLQEPLRMIHSFSDLLQNNYADVLDDRGRTWLNFASDGAQRMKRMIQDLLDYSRIERQAGEARSQSFARTLHVALQNLQQVFRDRNAVLVYDHLPVVRGDHPQLARVLQNLLLNAIKHNQQDKPLIHIFSEIQEDGWRISVCDNGPGIPVKQQSRIFELFQRATSKKDGSGIGLAVCQRIITRHGGFIGVGDCASDDWSARKTLPECNGAHFWFYLPRNPEF